MSNEQLARIIEGKTGTGEGAVVCERTLRAIIKALRA